MTELEKELLKELIVERLEANWKKCDVLPSGSAEYNSLTDECSILKQIAEKLKISLPVHIYARF